MRVEDVGLPGTLGLALEAVCLKAMELKPAEAALADDTQTGLRDGADALDTLPTRRGDLSPVSETNSAPREPMSDGFAHRSG